MKMCADIMLAVKKPCSCVLGYYLLNSIRLSVGYRHLHTVLTDPVYNIICLHLSFMSLEHSIHVQWIPAHVGLSSNTLADLEVKRGTILHSPWSQSTWLQQRLWSGRQDTRSSMPTT